MLTITLDESDCFAAWVSAKDAGFSSSDGSDPKCKISDLTPFLLSRKMFDSKCDRIHCSYLDLFLCLVVNLGGLLLQALLEFWPRTRINPMDEEENEVNHGKDPLLLLTGFPVVVNDWQVFQVRLCFCAHSERRTGKPGAERKWLFPSATTHSCHLWGSRRQNSI